MMQVETVTTCEFNLSADCEVFRRVQYRIKREGDFRNKIGGGGSRCR